MIAQIFSGLQLGYEYNVAHGCMGQIHSAQSTIIIIVYATDCSTVQCNSSP